MCLRRKIRCYQVQYLLPRLGCNSELMQLVMLRLADASFFISAARGAVHLTNSLTACIPGERGGVSSPLPPWPKPTWQLYLTAMLQLADD